MQTNLYPEILDNLPSAVFLIDNNLNVKYSNRAFSEIFAPSKSNLRVGNALNCSLLMGDQKCGEGRFCEKCILNKLLKRALHRGITVKREVLEKSIYISNVERFFRIRLSVKPLIEEAYKGQYVCVIDDITEIPQLTDRLNAENLHVDLRRAKKIQTLFLPDKKITKPLADFDYIYEQSYEVGGDFLDAFKVSDTEVAGYIADVSGAGLSGGMFTVFLHENYPKEKIEPSECLKTLSQRFNSYNFPEESYITVFSFFADTVSKKLSVCNAGHNVPAIFVNQGVAKVIDINGKTISCWYDSVVYQNEYFDYTTGDKLILMTDGIFDMQDSKGNEYGINRVVNIAQNNAQLEVSKLISLIKADLVSFLGELKPKNSDDKTVVVIELK